MLDPAARETAVMYGGSDGKIRFQLVPPRQFQGLLGSQSVSSHSGPKLEVCGCSVLSRSAFARATVADGWCVCEREELVNSLRQHRNQTQTPRTGAA